MGELMSNSGVSTAGINEVKLARLKLEINDYAERINNVFQCISDLVDGTEEYFQGSNGNLFREHFSVLKENFTIVNQNILSYIDDLSKVELNYRKMVDSVSGEIQKEELL